MPTATPMPTPRTPRPTATPVPVPTDVVASVEVNAYFLLDDGSGSATIVPIRRTVDTTRQVANAALRELLRGPTAAELELAPSGQHPFSAIPPDTLVLGIDASDGIATVDLSREFEAGAGSSVYAQRLAQVVYTLTQFRTITGVVFKLDGDPVPYSDAAGKPIAGPATREHYRELLPAIFIDTPAWGATVERPIVVAGDANVFEARFMLELTDDDGRVIVRRAVSASSGSGTWGEWTEELDIESTASRRLWLSVWSASAQDGSRENLRRYPIELPPRP